MKKLVLVCFVLISLLACKKESNNLIHGKITGIDTRKCASPLCGGFYIQINNTTYRCLEVPLNSTLDLSDETFPVNVVVHWKKDNTSGIDDLIIIEYLKKE